ncbi:MAG: response regulator [Woeseiaceae bacterium]
MTDKARVLFVDDEKRVLNSMRGLFRREYDLFLTTEGATAVKIAAEREIDVVVADQRMPGMTGVEVLSKIKEQSPRTIRILLTGYADPNAVEGSINVSEVFRFLSKPCPPQHLRETLELAIDAARTIADCAAQLSAAAKPAPAAAPEQHKAQPNQYPKTRSTNLPPTRPPVLRPIDRVDSVPSAAADFPAKPIAAIPKPRLAEPRTEKIASLKATTTDVVLSEKIDKKTELAENAAREIAMTKDVGVVVFTVDSQFAKLVIGAVSADRSTVLATTLSRAAHAFEQYDVGVLVTDYTTQSAVLQKILSTLKKYLPELVTIVVSGDSDTTDMINLINHGQVFRYLLKPVDPQSLSKEINAAAIRYMQVRKTPELAKRYLIEKYAGPSDSSPTLNDFVSRIQELRSQPLKRANNSN